MRRRCRRWPTSPARSPARQARLEVRLAELDPAPRTATTRSPRRSKTAALERLTDLQDRLWAEAKTPVLVVLQGIDAAGKDGTIRHVMAAFNPQGCHVDLVQGARQPRSSPTTFSGASTSARPRKGEIAIFNRSHYEDVLVVRVHNLVPRDVWSKRYDQINEFEQMLAENGTTIVKFFLHITKDEQRQRFQDRYDDPKQALEVHDRRPRGAQALGRVPGRASRRRCRDARRHGAVVRHPGEPEVVPQPRGRRRSSPTTIAGLKPAYPEPPDLPRTSSSSRALVPCTAAAIASKSGREVVGEDLVHLVGRPDQRGAPRTASQRSQRGRAIARRRQEGRRGRDVVRTGRYASRSWAKAGSASRRAVVRDELNVTLSRRERVGDRRRIPVEERSAAGRRGCSRRAARRDGCVAASPGIASRAVVAEASAARSLAPAGNRRRGRARGPVPSSSSSSATELTRESWEVGRGRGIAHGSDSCLALDGPAVSVALSARIR